MTTPDPEPRRVEPTGNPRVDALIDAMVCPSCRTIYNAAKAKCADPWHHDNRPADCHLAGMHPADCPAYVAGMATLRDRIRTTPPITFATGGPVEGGLTLPNDGGGCVMPTAEFRERLRVAMATQRVTVLPPSESEREQAAYERGVAEGRRQATEGWDREWALNGPAFTGLTGDEERVRGWASANPELTVVSRLVGPWEPAEHRFDPSSVRDLAVTPYSMFEESDDPYCICGGGWDTQTGCTTQQPGWTPAPPYDGPSLEELLPPAVD